MSVRFRGGAGGGGGGGGGNKHKNSLPACRNPHLDVMKDSVCVLC